MRSDGIIIAPVLRFCNDGVIGGYINLLERCWRLTGEKLALQDISGVTTTRFEVVGEDDLGVTEMRGKSLVDSRVEHVIQRIQMPSLADFEENNEADTIEFVREINKFEKKTRKNLVVLRANSKSLHYFWPKYISEEDRNWDLCISWYGSEVPEEIEGCEYFVHQKKERKFGAIFNLFSQKYSLLDYENFWFPDDDLETSWRDINRLFNIFTRSRLDLAQPSLAVNSSSFINHQVTAQNKEYLLRYSNFVELMCPIFTRETLKLCLPAFNGTKSAFCLDHIWGGLGGRVPGRMAIIDDVAVSHTRPMAVNYDGEEAMNEANRLAALYHIEGSYAITGGIDRDKIFL
ncbi:hypothetical protein AA13594_3007 [Gluconacetobacter azotocaptans DSM 13594]|nr:hypothetical protein AA13594_3007 [Gluconacetobacter azotocaptans DSM 13594]